MSIKRASVIIPKFLNSGAKLADCSVNFPVPSLINKNPEPGIP